MNLVLVELEKLRTVRGTWLLLALAVLGPIPLAIVILTQSQSLADAPEDVLGLVAIPGMLCSALGASACAHEFEHRTITTAFTLEPRRERIIAAKAVAAALVACAATVLFCAFAFSLTAIWISASGEPWPWTAGETLLGAVGGVAFVATVSVAGTGFGGITRHVGAAITLLVLVYLVLEGVLTTRLQVWDDYGVTAAATALVEPTGAHTLGFLPALGVMTGAALLYLLAGIAVVRRSDV